MIMEKHFFQFHHVYFKVKFTETTHEVMGPAEWSLIYEQHTLATFADGSIQKHEY